MLDLLQRTLTTATGGRIMLPKSIPVYVKIPELKRVEDTLRRQYATLNKQTAGLPIAMPVYMDEGKGRKTELSKIMEASLATLARDCQSINRGTWEQYAARYNDIPKRQVSRDGLVDMSMVTHVVVTPPMNDALQVLQVTMPQDLDIHSYTRSGVISPVVIGAIAVIHAATKA